MPRKKRGKQDCFGRKNILTLTCYTLCQSGRCSEEDQVACEAATERRLREYGLIPRKADPVRT